MSLGIEPEGLQQIIELTRVVQVLKSHTLRYTPQHTSPENLHPELKCLVAGPFVAFRLSERILALRFAYEDWRRTCSIHAILFEFRA